MHPVNQDDFFLPATRFLSGEASGAEREDFGKLLQSPALGALFAKIQQRWDAAKAKPIGGFDLTTAANSLATNIARERIPTGKKRSSKQNRGKSKVARLAGH